MKKTLSNVVIQCDTLKESFVAEQILTKRGYEYEMISDLYIEIYHELSPTEWLRIIEQIEEETRNNY